jgi:hypothetical protein
MNNWQRRQTTKFTCDSGNEVVLQRPGPSLSLKAGRFMRVLNKVGADKEDNAEEQLAAIQKLSDSELEELTEFARIVIADVIVSPVVSLKPKSGQYHPDDLPVGDFWQIFMWFSKGSPTIPVQTKEGETTVEAVSNFPEGREPDTTVSSDSEQVQ